MAEDAEPLQTLEHLWKDGRNGTMSPLEQMRAWVYREVMREYGEPEHGLYSKISGKVKKIGGGNPSGQALSDFFCKVDAD